MLFESRGKRLVGSRGRGELRDHHLIDQLDERGQIDAEAYAGVAGRVVEKVLKEALGFGLKADVRTI